MGTLDQLVTIVKRLRAPGGCPWDRAQSPGSLRPMLLEEAHEVIDAIDREDDDSLREELGDLLFCIALIAQMKSELGVFDLQDVGDAITSKMIRRHPHVFGDATHGGVRSWEAIKASERADRHHTTPSALDGVPRALPALLRAQRIGAKASAVGFDWSSLEGPRAKLDEEIAELDEAVIGAQLEQTGTESATGHGPIVEELGDVLFSVVNVARHLGVSAEDALRAATDKFERRFRLLENTLRQEGQDPSTMNASELESRWQALKTEAP